MEKMNIKLTENSIPYQDYTMGNPRWEKFQREIQPTKGVSERVIFEMIRGSKIDSKPLLIKESNPYPYDRWKQVNEGK